MDRLLTAFRPGIPDDRTTWQALRAWSFYRVLVAMLFAGLFFSPILSEALTPAQAKLGRILTGLLLILAPALYLSASQYARRPGLQTLAGVLCDLTFTTLLLRTVGALDGGVGTLLVGSMVLVGAIVPLRLALLVASGGAIVLLWHALEGLFSGSVTPAAITSAGTLGAAYFVTALIGSFLAGKARESQALAQQRSLDLANLAELNELIIERMRTGIMLIDENNNAHLMNEAAWYLAGMPELRTEKLESYAPELLSAVEAWREQGSQPQDSIKLSTGVPSIVPRFAALAGETRGEVLAFLEDTSMLSRRAHELTLASLGRLSASIAHEIRNPLAAISHSAQLLGESPQLSPPDGRLAAIILRHCGRMNDIVENVLDLARQTRTQPSPLRLDRWLQGFVDEFRRFQDVSAGHLELTETEQETWVMVDTSQLQQVLWNLCKNAMKYGRRESEPAFVTILWGTSEADGAPFLEVRDQGPGIPPEHRDRIFEPFFTTSEDGSGLGLYLCRQLIEANQGTIRYAHDGAGSGFRISFARAPRGVEPDPGAEARHADRSTDLARPGAAG